ncbi:SirB2 family protein [Piscinibacter gummiphilus]|uniref:SirB2 family protein n=1 Tax=Piscinibacter gummiphilus TaxID=946333 RepID=A0ABZ0CX83_9BURK|nr:SirB2 family protein [Piscinibacter gummiphilus]WOB09579.1 SirB2 family protein [Piscinibacter gummiphilus]
MDYATVKLIHQSAVVLSIGGFVLRAFASLMGARWVKGRAAKTLPHVIDTVLLASAVTLAVWLHLNPLTTAWLAAKIVALLVYIGLGMVALKPSRPAPQRSMAMLAAFATLAYIVSVAVTKNPLPFVAS